MAVVVLILYVTGVLPELWLIGARIAVRISGVSEEALTIILKLVSASRT